MRKNREERGEKQKTKNEKIKTKKGKSLEFPTLNRQKLFKLFRRPFYKQTGVSKSKHVVGFY